MAVGGCGPCGVARAMLLARQSQRVTLFELCDEPRAIGSGLMIQPSGQAGLDELGLLDRVMAQGSRIDRLFDRAGDWPKGKVDN